MATRLQEDLKVLLEVLQDPSDLSKLDEWCEILEAIWRHPSGDGTGEAKRADDDESSSTTELLLENAERLLREASARLQFLVFQSLTGGTLEEKEEQLDGQPSEQLVREIIASIQDGSFSIAKKPELTVHLRASKNFLRWFLQIYQSSVALLTRNNSSSKTMSPDPIPEWKSLCMLELYLSLLQQFTRSGDPVLAQHVAQVLFYASYNPISGSDAGLQESYNQLLQEKQFLTVILECLVHSPTTPLTLSLVRNLHNILVTFPKGAEYAAKATVKIVDFEEEESSLAPWAVRTTTTNNHAAAADFSDGDDGSAVVVVTFQTALPLIALWALKAEPAFPGHENDKRAELVVEIQRACYVMRTGSHLQGDGPVAEMILSLLRLDPSEPRCEDCRRASVSLLMDVSGDMASYLLSQDALAPLLSVWEDQVTEVLEEQLVNDGAAAQLTPVLIVLHKFCNASPEVRQSTKRFLVPPDAETEFQCRYRLEIAAHGNPRNMSPLGDAPKGTLRWKMIQLLTWPQSHVKRFAGELLWALCENDAQEFIARFGMGNAVPILGAKGIVQLPI